MTTKIGTIGHNGDVYLNWLDTETGERGAGYFNMGRLCELGYGSLHVDEDLVIGVKTVELGRAPL